MADGRVIIVCGGRRYRNPDKVMAVLNEEHAADPISVVYEGGATGADVLARSWAYDHDITVRSIEADWQLHGKAAGPIRNQRMLDFGATALIAFPGGRGTAHMVRIAKAKGIAVREVDDG